MTHHLHIAMFVNVSETSFAIKRIYVSMYKKNGLMSFFNILQNAYLSNTDYLLAFLKTLLFLFFRYP